MPPAGQPNLDVRLTRSQSGSILDIDFVGVMGLEPEAAGSMGPPPPVVGRDCGSSSSSSSMALSTAVLAHGRRLKILEHRVHKVEVRTKEGDEQEEELVVSNLRPFTIKVGVHDDTDAAMYDCTLPLRATLLYENGLPVKQTSTSEPLLVGETDVVALQGVATFKLRITSLSSHRDKQRFRIQISPQESELVLNERGLEVVTEPMKSVTKLGRATASSLPPPCPPNPADGASALDPALKRKYRDTLEEHASQMRSLYATQAAILQELGSLAAIARQRTAPTNGH